MPVNVHRSHHRSRAEARALVEEMAGDLAEQLGLTYDWEAGDAASDRLAFRGTGVSGFIAVDDETVHVHVKRRFFLPVSEARIRAGVEERMDEHLTPPPADEPPADEPPAGAPLPDEPAAGGSATGPSSAPAAEDPLGGPAASEESSPLVSMAVSAFRLAAGSGRVPGAALEALLLSPDERAALSRERQRHMREMGAHLRTLREQAGWSVQELAERVGVANPSFLRAVEAGQASLSRDLIARLAVTLAQQPMALAERLARAYGVR